MLSRLAKNVAAALTPRLPRLARSGGETMSAASATDIAGKQAKWCATVKRPGVKLGLRIW
jgi:hypothetical protein